MRALKFAGLFILTISILALNSCMSGESSTRADSVKRETITGSWKLVKQSSEALNFQENQSEDWPLEFQLNNDSTVTMRFDDSKNAVKGKWHWKPSIEIGNNSMSIGVGSDLGISYWESDTDHRYLGLTIAEDSGKLSLNFASDITYEQVPGSN